ncbi:hypothetical protein A3Q56_06147 [Intoshia linei]|uniref:BED-type domain-containing protein n=1 Tax=Intoshia linei TaxID=1819745 RepID=A0A177AVU3_9BILA|nr:hypothetical protein A3Q56_06147 [Intoshia linei]
MQKIRKWNNEYVRYGFTGLIESGKHDIAQCMNCHFVMCNSNLKPYLLRIFALREHDITKNRKVDIWGDKLSHDMRVGLSQTKPDMINLFTINNNKTLIKKCESFKKKVETPCSIYLIFLMAHMTFAG